MTRSQLKIEFHRWPQETVPMAIVERLNKDLSDGVSEFLKAPSIYKKQLPSLEKTLEKAKKNHKVLLHVGIGGSSLGPEALISGLGSRFQSSRQQAHQELLKSAESPKNQNRNQDLNKSSLHETGPSSCFQEPGSSVVFMDHLDPSLMADFFENHHPRDVFVYIVTKSGTTVETLATMECLESWYQQQGEKLSDHVAFCTDPSAEKLIHLIRPWNAPRFEISSHLGGRYSVLSPVGAVPGFFASLNIESFFQGGVDTAEELSQTGSTLQKSASRICQGLVSLTKEGQSMSVLFSYLALSKTWGDWWVQLWAESLGKDRKGLTPLFATGPKDQHSTLQLFRDGPQDKTFGFITAENENHNYSLGSLGFLPSNTTVSQLRRYELEATRSVLLGQGSKAYTVSLPRWDAYHLGSLFVFYEYVTALTGYALGVNPFDQPGVEEGKQILKRKLAETSLPLSSLKPR